jgi:hypothetical protein
MTYIDALHFISNRVATVELFPYHSVDGSTLARLGKWQQMPSTVRAQQFFCEIASNPNVLKLVVRSHAHWTNGTEYPDTHHFHQAPRSRGFTFNSKAGEKSGIAGERLLARLKLSRRS